MHDVCVCNAQVGCKALEKSQGRAARLQAGAAGENTTQHMPHSPVSLLERLSWLPGI
jgi:hypothetical protein